MKFGPIGVLEALKMAIQTEIDMDHFFTEAYKSSSDDEVRTIFRKYSREGKKRRKGLQEEYRRISGKRLLYLNLNRKKKLDMSMVSHPDRNGIVTTAQQNIKVCYDFYSDVSSRLLESDFRIIFRNLAEEKEQQLAYLVSKFPTEEQEEQKMKGITTRSTVTEAA
jgi:rubrerythrin